MKNKVLLMSAVLLLLGVGSSKSFGQFPGVNDPSLQELTFNTPTSGVIDSSDANFFTAEAVLANGFDLSGYTTGSGLGTITYSLTNSGSSTISSFFDVFFDEEVGSVFDNEFGGNSGSPLNDANGVESWEIGDSFASNIFNDFSADSLQNTNYLPSGATNLPSSPCTPNPAITTGNEGCNGDVATALGLSFSLAADSEEIITVAVTTSAPGGFYLSQTNPDWDGTGTAETVYFSLTDTQVPAGSPPPPPPSVTPEPSSWVLVATGLGAGITRLRRRFSLKVNGKFLSVLVLLVAALVVVPMASAQSVSTVPWIPTSPASPHTAYSGASVVLAAVFNTNGSADPFTYVWNFGDGTPIGSPASVTNPNDISARHVYAGTSVGQEFTATVTVTDTTTSAQYTGTYLVQWQNNTLQSRVNVAIDLGLWYLHEAMYHPSATTGNWDQSCSSFPPVSGNGYACSGYGSLTATNVQAFEVNGHLATGPANDPYTNDVAEGLSSLFPHLSTSAVASKQYTFNPATTNYACSDGTAASTSGGGSCTSPATPVFFNAGATSCTTAPATPCNYTFDGNSNGQMIFANQQGYSWGYEAGQYADALVASGTPNATAGTGPSGIIGESFQNIVQDIADAAEYCQYGGDPYDVQTGYARGSEPYQGGGWWYDCQEGDDNSVSQWASIGLIGAQRGFGLTIPTVVTDANNMWVTASEDMAGGTQPTGPNPWNNFNAGYGGDYYGGFGYNGALNYSQAWGSFATTPSGMVQMSMDGIGRTKNVVFGDATTDPDQRFNSVESYYADNFCNTTGGAGGGSSAAYDAPRAYTYGMFSFTKSMLLHNPGGSLTPIQYLRTQTPGVFTTNVSVPANSIDWYAALSPAHGGTDPCDGVAQTLINNQNTDGHWYADNYSSAQYPYETAWAVIMLQRTVFVSCVNNLGGVGTANSGINPARVDLSWTGIPNVTGYNVLRSSSNGGPYAQVGTTATTIYSDRTGLSNLGTYYYVLQPVNGSGAVCQSNQATVTVPKGR